MPDSAAHPPHPGPGRTLDVTLGRYGADVLVTVTGEIDLLSTPRFAAGLAEALDVVAGRAPGVRVLCDLSGVEFMGSHGMAALIEAAVTAQEAGRRLWVVVPGRSLLIRSLRIGGLEHLCGLYESLDAVP